MSCVIASFLLFIIAFVFDIRQHLISFFFLLLCILLSANIYARFNSYICKKYTLTPISKILGVRDTFHFRLDRLNDAFESNKMLNSIPNAKL